MNEQEQFFPSGEGSKVIKDVTIIDYKGVAKYLKRGMRDTGLDIKEVAKKARVGKRFVWELLRGQPRNELREISRVLEAVGYRLGSFSGMPSGEWENRLSKVTDDYIPAKFVKVIDEDWFTGTRRMNNDFFTKGGFGA